MKKKSFVPTTDGPLSLWLKNLAAKLPALAPKYNLTVEEINKVSNASASLAHWLDVQNQANQFMRKVTAYKNELIDGVEAGGQPSVVPQPPLVFSYLTTAAPGLVSEVVSIMSSIKKKSQYTEADGKDLGLEGAEMAETTTGQPAISVRIANNNQPEILWEKGNMDSIEIHKDSGNGEWKFLAVDSYPHYTDKAPAPAGGAVWRYKAIYRRKDEFAGGWSNVVSIAVGA